MTTEAEVPQVYTIVGLKWIAEKMPIGTIWKVIQKQAKKNLVQITFMKQAVGRPKKE